MKTQNVNNNKLSFDKNSLIELNDKSLENVNGGSSKPCYALITYLLTK